MITSNRDYILRIIDEVTRMVARVVFKRRGGADEEALEILVQGYERLFALDRSQLFQFTPDQQFVMLTLDEPPDLARDKVLLYAALSAEAGRVYAKMGNARMAQATFLNALRFTLKARGFATDAPLPECAPNVYELITLAGGHNALDPETAAMVDALPPPAE
ncbi:MAG TPA: hypothetical protein VHE61_22575 [Opitutaceae bacterium]|nr:hypothetical protein [Opitutaceae bacterium]